MKLVFATPLYRAYRLPSCKIQCLIRTIICKLEKGEFYSPTLRRIFRDYHGTDIGMYTHGGCFNPANVQSNVTIGRYCSIARTVRFVTHNHPAGFLSTHGFFFNPTLGFCDRWQVGRYPMATLSARRTQLARLAEDPRRRIARTHQEFSWSIDQRLLRLQ